MSSPTKTLMNLNEHGPALNVFRTRQRRVGRNATASTGHRYDHQARARSRWVTERIADPYSLDRKDRTESMPSNSTAQISLDLPHFSKKVGRMRFFPLTHVLMGDPFRRLRRQGGQKSLNSQKNPEMNDRVTNLRSECGYSATFYDGTAAKLQKYLRQQFGLFYDQKKVRNIHACGMAERVWG